MVGVAVVAVTATVVVAAALRAATAVAVTKAIFARTDKLTDMSHHEWRSSAPLRVKILAVWTAVDGLLAVMAGLGSANVGGLPVGLVLLAVGGLQLVVAYGIWVLEPYAYPWGMTLFGISFVLDLAVGNVLGAGASAVNLVVLHHFRDLFRD